MTQVADALRMHHEWSLRNMPGYSEHGDERVAYRATVAALSSPTHERAAPAPEPLTESYVQPVPDHCDRITWRNRYYSLPLASPSQPVAAEGVMEPMTWPEIDEAARRAQISFCLDKKPSFEIALVREVEAHHGIASGSAESKKGE